MATFFKFIGTFAISFSPKTFLLKINFYFFSIFAFSQNLLEIWPEIYQTIAWTIYWKFIWVSEFSNFNGSDFLMYCGTESQYSFKFMTFIRAMDHLQILHVKLICKGHKSFANSWSLNHQFDKNCWTLKTQLIYSPRTCTNLTNKFIVHWENARFQFRALNFEARRALDFRNLPSIFLYPNWAYIDERIILLIFLPSLLKIVNK